MKRHSMLRFESALRMILNGSKKLDIIEIPIYDAVGYVIAQDIRAPHDMPPFNRSAMDGYAVRSKDVNRIPVELKCKAVIMAGSSASLPIKEGECMKIMTGAALPRGADSVVMSEYVRKGSHPECVRICRNVMPGENVSKKGENRGKGVVLIKKGTEMTGPHVSLLASIGRAKVKVYRRPEVCVMCTGDEVLPQGRALSSGKVYNSNGPMLISVLRDMKIKVRYLGIVRDRKKVLAKAVKRGLTSDVLIISGGVSMGDRDIVPEVLVSSGVKKLFHRVSIKPGKPLFFGKYGTTLVFGVPGKPVSSFLVFLLLIKPALLCLAGKVPSIGFSKGILNLKIKEKRGRKEFLPAMLIDRSNRIEAVPIRSYNGSFDIASLSLANGFICLTGRGRTWSKGSEIGIMDWR